MPNSSRQCERALLGRCTPCLSIRGMGRGLLKSHTRYTLRCDGTRSERLGEDGQVAPRRLTPPPTSLRFNPIVSRVSSQRPPDLSGGSF